MSGDIDWNAVPRDQLTAALRAVLDLADEYAERAQATKDGFWRRHLAQVSQRIYAAVSAAVDGADQ